MEPIECSKQHQDRKATRTPCKFNVIHVLCILHNPVSVLLKGTTQESSASQAWRNTSRHVKGLHVPVVFALCHVPPLRVPWHNAIVEYALQPQIGPTFHQGFLANVGEIRGA